MFNGHNFPRTPTILPYLKSLNNNTELDVRTRGLSITCTHFHFPLWVSIFHVGRKCRDDIASGPQKLNYSIFLKKVLPFPFRVFVMRITL
jgi:hypothetical protein